MALQIAIPVGASGITATYWRHAEGGWSFANLPPGAAGESEAPDGMFWLSFVGYRDSAARIGGLEPVPGASLRIWLTYGDVQRFVAEAGGNFRTAVYLAAKAAPVFSGAEDA